MSSSKKTSVFAAGLALFSMFFGAGNLVFPLILGGAAGQHVSWSLLGLVITDALLPLFGLLAMMLFNCDYRSFFGRIGRVPGIIFFLVMQLILGPIGSIPRIIILMYGTLKPYLPAIVGLGIFSIAACVLFGAMALRRTKLVDLLGYILTPVLLGSLALIVVLGVAHAPAIPDGGLSVAHSFGKGLRIGYNTLDLIASFLFATLIMDYFRSEGEGLNPQQARKVMVKKFFKASVIAVSLMALVYSGLCYVGAAYVPLLPVGTPPEEYLPQIAHLLLGSYGAAVSAIAVVFACLTTAVSLTLISTDYIRSDWFKGKTGIAIPLVITLALSGGVALLGFMGLTQMLAPVLDTLCPALIVLSLFNIAHKLYRVRPIKIPVALAFGASILSLVV